MPITSASRRIGSFDILAISGYRIIANKTFASYWRKTGGILAKVNLSFANIGDRPLNRMAIQTNFYSCY